MTAKARPVNTGGTNTGGMQPEAAQMTSSAGSTIDPAEVARFDALARNWWDMAGPMAVLHRFNPVRLGWIRDAACNHFGRDPKHLDSLDGLTIVDIGCGGGVLSEPLARLGAEVTGLDPATTNIEVAKRHAVQGGLEIDYRATTIEEVVAEGRQFDIVLAMEVVEHVADVEAFVASACRAVRPGGLLVMATLNRTLKSFALAIVGAEYVLRWLPRGTHDWDRFVTPDELAAAITQNGLAVSDTTGVTYTPFADRWSLSEDTDVNYMMCAVQAG